MSPGRAEAHAEDARSALTRRLARSYLRPDIAPSHRACAVDSRESTSVPSHLSSTAPLLSAEPTGLKPTHTCFRRAEKGGVEETFAALEAAVEADVDAFLRRGSVNAQDFETLLQTVHRRALATATRVVKRVGAQRS